MKVILIKDVKNLGKRNDIVEVNNGYANNFLFKQKLAVPYTNQSLHIKEEEEKKKKEQEIENKNNALETKKKLVNKEATFKLKKGENNKFFGSITSKNIEEYYDSEFNIKIDRKKMIDFKNINDLGIYKIRLILYKDVETFLVINVVEDYKNE